MNQAPSPGSTRPIIPAGTQLNGIYEIDEPIAAGGMGEVYKGHAIQTGDIVAIKLIRPDLAEAEAAFAMFRKEASALHNLYHEAIVRYYVFTIDPALERPYLAMEYVDGLSLSTMLRGGPLAFEAVVRLMRRIASGLAAAHERGIVHRDVSSDNIIIPAGDMGQAKIIDFGIARSTQLEDEGTVIGTGFAGKYNYVSPEQLGLFGADITPKSDIYSLGLVLSEALRGQPIDMGGNHVEVVEKRRVIPDLSGVDARLRPLIEQMLEPNPDDRPSSMAEIAVWSPDAPPIARRRRKRRTAGAKPAGLTISRMNLAFGAAAIAGLAAAALALYPALRPAPRSSPPPPVLQGDLAATAGRPAPPAPPARADPVKPGLAPMDLRRLDPEPPAAVEPGEAAARRIRLAALVRTLDDYDGGGCFFAAPVVLADGSPAIEGYGLNSAPFRALDQAIRRADGFEADIGVRQVAEPQCPAIAFLNQLRKTPAVPIRLELTASSLRAGQPISGSVSGADGREIAVLVVAADGTARALPATLSGADGALTFSARLDPGEGGQQLILAVAGEKPLAGLRPGQPTASAKLFPAALSEAEKNGGALAATARAFKIDK